MVYDHAAESAAESMVYDHAAESAAESMVYDHAAESAAESMVYDHAADIAYEDIDYSLQGKFQRLPPTPPYHPLPSGKIHARDNIRSFTVG